MKERSPQQDLVVALFFPFFQTRLTRKKKNRTEAPLVEDIPDTLTLVFYKIMRKLGRFFLSCKNILVVVFELFSDDFVILFFKRKIVRNSFRFCRT